MIAWYVGTSPTMRKACTCNSYIASKRMEGFSMRQVLQSSFAMLVYMYGSLMVLYGTLAWEMPCMFCLIEVTCLVEVPCLVEIPYVWKKVFPWKNAEVACKIRYGPTRVHACKNEVVI